jgi:hypothetical protein
MGRRVIYTSAYRVQIQVRSPGRGCVLCRRLLFVEVEVRDGIVADFDFLVWPLVIDLGILLGRPRLGTGAVHGKKGGRKKVATLT